MLAVDRADDLFPSTELVFLVLAETGLLDDTFSTEPPKFLFFEDISRLQEGHFCK